MGSPYPSSCLPFLFPLSEILRAGPNLEGASGALFPVCSWLSASMPVDSLGVWMGDGATPHVIVTSIDMWNISHGLGGGSRGAQSHPALIPAPPKL